VVNDREPPLMNQLARNPWPADRVERRPVAELVPYAKNARTHSEAQIDQICASMREWGFTIPVLIDERGEIIAGHGRIMAASRLGYESVPTMVAEGWSQRQIKAYRLADNQLALNSAWDVTLLAAELEGLSDMSALIGFGEGELEAMLKGGAADEDQPQTPEEARRTLAERFGLPPFSVLNARDGWWQERKRAWLALGIESELGRGENLLQFSDTINEPDPEKRRAEAIRRGKLATPGGGGTTYGGKGEDMMNKARAKFAEKGKGKPKAATFMTGAARGGGNFNDQVVGKKRGRPPRHERGLTWGNEPALTEPGLEHYRHNGGPKRRYGKPEAAAIPAPAKAGGGEAQTYANDLLQRRNDVRGTPNKPPRKRKAVDPRETASLESGLVLGTTADPYGRGRHDVSARPDPAAIPRKRTENVEVVAGKGWAEGGPARRDPAFYAKKRAWEKANGRTISTTEFREKHWDGAK